MISYGRRRPVVLRWVFHKELYAAPLIVVCVKTEVADKPTTKTLNDKDSIMRSAANNPTGPHDNIDQEDDDSWARSVCRADADLAVAGRRMYRHAPAAINGYYNRQCVCLSVCHCSASHRCSSVNTSLYPMVGSCTTSSCHVDSMPRPLTDCSTCCVYEYALDSFQASGLSLDSAVEESDMAVDVDCSAMKGTSMSWSTVHSAPAVLGRLSRYKLPVSHSSLYNCTTVRHAHDRRERYAAHRRDRRDELCCYHSPFYYGNAARYQPVTYAYTTAAAAAAAAYDAEDDDYERYDKLAPSLRLAKPVLAETQYWV